MKETKKFGFSVFTDCDNIVNICKIRDGDVQIYKFDFTTACDFVIDYSFECLDFSYTWHPNCKTNRSLQPDWATNKSISVNDCAPVVCFYDNNGINSYTIACSEVKKKMCFSFGVNEFLCAIKGKIASYCDDNYSMLIYIDKRKIKFHSTLMDVGKWWGVDKINVPDEAYMPVYSSWYAFHQFISSKNLEQECEMAAKLGMKTLIVDDGWHTGNSIALSGDYSYCGDWNVSEEKFPDMKEHVKTVHSYNMKYIVWYGVPFIGFKSKIYNRFSDKILYKDESMKTGIIDPRYPEVREYIISKLENMIKSYDVDGFKLDFIDRFHDNEESNYAHGMDYKHIEEAVVKLLSDINNRLSKLKKDCLIEFRQFYQGPVMCSFCNMMRVADCPEDYLSNRIGIVDLRLLCGKTAVHSDMIMWHNDETTENAALYILNSLFSTIQLSVNLERQDCEKLEMIKFWLGFANEKCDTLLKSQFLPENPELLYPIIKAKNKNEEIIGVYIKNQIINIEDNTTYIINATSDEFIYISYEGKKTFNITARDCMGKIKYCDKLTVCGLTKLCVPKSGLLKIE